MYLVVTFALFLEEAINEDGTIKTANKENGITNGHTNGHTNGYTNGHTNGYSKKNGTNGAANGYARIDASADDVD